MDRLTERETDRHSAPVRSGNPSAACGFPQHMETSTFAQDSWFQLLIFIHLLHLATET